MPIQHNEYRFEFSKDSVYDRALRLVGRLSSPPGLLIDIGCGYGPIAEPASDLGFQYIGLDLDTQSLEDLKRRGFETHQVDLDDTAGLSDLLSDLVHQVRVSGILMLDIVEHLVNPEGFLKALSETVGLATTNAGNPIFVVSMPNVANFELGAKLLSGRWDITSTGLLDRTHLSFFTDRRLSSLMRKLALVEVARDDVIALPTPDQHFPVDHPAINPDTTLGEYLLWFRNSCDVFGSTYQFVRAYAHLSTGINLTDTPNRNVADREPFLTAMVYVEGPELDNLTELLLCLAAQDISDSEFDILLLTNSFAAQLIEDIKLLLDSFGSHFANRVKLLTVPSDSVQNAYNSALATVTSRYVAFLSEYDLLCSDWAVRFLEATGPGAGKVILTKGCERFISKPSDVQAFSPYTDAIKAPYITMSGLNWSNGLKPFDLILELSNPGSVPLAAVGFPYTLFCDLNLRFDESLVFSIEKGGGWDVFIKAVLICGVYECEYITAIHQRRLTSPVSTDTVSNSAKIDKRMHELTLTKLDMYPLLLPVGSATVLSATVLPTTGLMPTVSEVDSLRVALNDQKRQYQEILNSSSWKITGPLRWVGGLLRRLRSVWAVK
ncbi:MAG: class I SAM-dependent methyltransferase [Actinobacteria bacterium]|nr:class I SAM-dependent methyltransferase [Actinomycetota bacterium]MCL6105335.1 class I SAM-dependent methyltransferase [Actinomycetota bacterium]